MPSTLEAEVQRLINAGVPRADIDRFIDEELARETPTPPSTFANEPTTFAGGVMKSLTSGEALKTGLQGGLGWLKGATLDLPSTMISGATGLAKLGANAMMGPFGNAPEMGQEMVASALKMPGQLSDMTMRSGSEPEAFGRTVGQVTGQPLATAGVGAATPKVVPPVVRGVGGATAGLGKIAAKYQPLSGLIPFGGIRTARNIERGIGKGMINVGERLKRVGKPAPPVIDAEIVNPPWTEGEIIPTPEEMFTGPRLPPSETDFFAGPPISPERALPPPYQGPIQGFGGEVPPYTPPAPMQPILRPSRGQQFNLPEQTSTSVPGQFTDITTGQVLSPDDLVSRMANPTQRTINASGESAASAEAISRQAGMKAARKSFVVYDKAGNKRPLIGPDAVDYVAKRGETYGIESPDGFQVLDNKGGKVPPKPTAGAKPPTKLTGPVQGKTYVIKRERVTPDFLQSAHAKGYKLMGVDEQGNAKFMYTGKGKP